MKVKSILEKVEKRKAKKLKDEQFFCRVGEGKNNSL